MAEECNCRQTRKRDANGDEYVDFSTTLCPVHRERNGLDELRSQPRDTLPPVQRPSVRVDVKTRTPRMDRKG